MPILIGAGVLAVLALTGGGKRRPSLSSLGFAPEDFPKKVYGIPFAVGDPSPAWPIITTNQRKWVVSYRADGGNIVGNGARRFMADRGGQFHAGIDLYGNPGDMIVAMESGTIVNYYHFFHGSYCLIVQCDSGLVINYGEVAKNSWKEFGLSKGSRVKKGKAIARVGLMSGGSHMLHFETYTKGVTHNIRIFSTRPDSKFRNPGEYLLIAKGLNEPETKERTVAALMPDDSVRTEFLAHSTMPSEAAGP